MPDSLPSAEGDAIGREWFEGGDGHGYVYQYIGPIHYLCECGDYFLNRGRWIAHKALAPVLVVAAGALASLDDLCANEDRHGDIIRAHEVRGAVADLRALVIPPERLAGGGTDA